MIKQIEKNYKIDWLKILSKNNNSKIKQTLSTSLAVINKILLKQIDLMLKNDLKNIFRGKTVDFLYNKTIEYKKQYFNLYLRKIYIFFENY